MMKIRRWWLAGLAFLILGGVLIVCAVQKPVISRNSFYSQIGTGGRFGNPELAWMKTSKEQIADYFQISEEQMAASSDTKQKYSTNAIAFKDIQADTIKMEFVFHDARCTQLTGYTFELSYEKREQWKQDYERIQSYLKREYPESAETMTAKDATSIDIITKDDPQSGCYRIVLTVQSDLSASEAM